MVDQKEPMAEKCECDHSRSEHADTGKGPGQGHCRHEKGNRKFGSEGAGFLHKEDICTCASFKPRTKSATRDNQ